MPEKKAESFDEKGVHAEKPVKGLNWEDRKPIAKTLRKIALKSKRTVVGSLMKESAWRRVSTFSRDQRWRGAAWEVAGGRCPS